MRLERYSTSSAGSFRHTFELKGITMKYVFATLLIFAGLAFGQPGKHGEKAKKPAPPPPVSSTLPLVIPMDPSIWLIEHRDDPTTQAKLVNGALVFPINPYTGEVDNGNWNNYSDYEPWLANPTKGKTSKPASYDVSQASTLTVKMRVQTTGQPTWRYDSSPDNDCVYPPHIRPYFAVGENNARYNDTGRWWSNSAQPGTNFELDTLPPNADVTFTLVMNLDDPSQFSDADGEFGNLNSTTTSQFAATKKAVGEMGVTWGGGCFFGHGVAVQGGTATITFYEFRFDK